MDKKQENINTVFFGKMLWIFLGTFVSSITYSDPDTRALEQALQKKELPEKINTGTFSASKSWLIQYLREERRAHNNKNASPKHTMMGIKNSKHTKNHGSQHMNRKIDTLKKSIP